jgi:hypothetical protein
VFCHVLYGSRSLQIWRSLIGFLCEPGLLLYRHKSRVIFTTLEALLSGGGRHFSLLCVMQTDCGAQPASCSMGFGVLPRGWSDQGVMLTTYLDLAPKLVMDELYFGCAHVPSWHEQVQIVRCSHLWLLYSSVITQKTTVSNLNQVAIFLRFYGNPLCSFRSEHMKMVKR